MNSKHGKNKLCINERNLSGKINLNRNDKYVALSNLSIYYT